jgi:DNA-directed DNA polymerase III PolC
LKNFISPNTHLSSFFTGSTVESMIKKAKELDTGYCVCTDNGYLTNIMKGYSKAKKEGLKFIAGCELYFVDKECDIIKGTKAEQIKYYTITVHAKTQDAYQFLVKKISEKSRTKIDILDQEYPTFNWADLQEFSMRDFTVVLGGPQDIVCKNLLVDEAIVGAKIFNKLKNMFGQNLYASIIPIEFDKKWESSSIFTFTDGQTVTLDSSLMAETHVAKTFRVPLEEVAEKHGRHRFIKRIYVNGIGYNVNKDIMSACNHKDFKPINTDIYKKYNEFIRKLALRFETKILLNDYSYFANEGDKLVQDLKLGDEHRLYTKLYMRSSEDVKEYFSKHYDLEYLNDLIENTYEWAKEFDNFELKYDYQLVKEHDNHLKATMELVEKIGRFDKNNPEHVKRLRHELEVIHNNGKIDLLPYFFPISRVLNYYTDQGRVIGPARGSAGGSFLMYCMGITQIDPLKYGLYFSRFLTLGRILKGTLPDVDVDLPDRNLLMGPDGFFEKNYKGRWAQLSTRTLMKLKSSVRDVNRFKHGSVEEAIEKFAKSLEATPQGVSDQDFVFGYEDNDGSHVPGLLEKDEKLMAYTKERPEEWEIVKRTLGISRQNGRHACGFVLSENPLIETIPLMKVGDNENVTQYEPSEVEAAGLNKYDFLIVKCLNDIELALKYINERNDKVLDAMGSTNEEPEREAGHFIHKGKYTYIWDLPEESEVFQMLGEGKTETVFQLNTTSVTPFVMKMKPKTVEECAVVTSLVRPGPLDFVDEKTGRNMAEEYIERVHGRSQGEIEILNRLLPETHGVFVFQEQITKLTKEMTGWDDEKAEDVRIAVGKKKLRMIQELRPQFIEASVSNGIVDERTATEVWGMIETFGRYGFNKSHAVAYAMIAYACAYLKHHYPLEWWAAVLSNAEEKEITEVLWPHVRDILSPPDINLSKEEMVIDYDSGTIRSKLSVLKGLGEKVANKITGGRPYKDIQDFVEKKTVGHSLARKLIHVGVLDSLFPAGSNLMEKMQAFENAVEVYKYKEKIMKKSDEEIFYDQPLEDFIEAAKLNEKTRRCKHEIKEGKIDEKYIFMNPVKDYILKKSIFPTMPMQLTSIIKENSNKVKIINTSVSSFALNSQGQEIRLMSGKAYQNLKSLECQPNSNKVINFCLAAYVVEAKEFSYKNGERKALKIIVDIDGYLEEFVIWPDYESGVLTYPEELKKNSVIFLFMYRKMNKEKYHTNIDDLVVEDIILD